MPSFLEELLNPTIRGANPWEAQGWEAGGPLAGRFAGDPAQAPAIPPGWMPELTPKQKAPIEIDYSGGVPQPYRGRAPSTKELWDRDASKFQETNPIPPGELPQMNAQAPIPGLLGANIAPQMPPGVQGAPQVAPLPPPINVGPAPGTPPQPPVMASSAPSVAPGAPPVAPAGAGGPPTDVSAQSRVVPPAGPGQPKGLLQRFDEMTQKNPALLMSLASGFLGAPSLATGASRAFGNAANALPVDQAMNLKSQGPAATYRALLQAGVPPHLALAASQNPEILKQIAPSYLADRKAEIKTLKSKDLLGNESERMVSVNPYTNEVKDLTPEVRGGNKDVGGGISITPQMTQAMQQPEAIDPATGKDEAFIKALDPVTRDAVLAADRGDLGVSSRNLQKLQPLITRYNPNWNIGDFTQRQKFRTEMGSATPSSWGGQRQLVGTSLGHLADAADAASKLDNSNGLGIAPLGHAANWAKNTLSTENAAKVNQLNETAARFAGEVGKLYSGSTGGGVHEREATAARFGSVKTSAELIGALEASKELITSKINSLQAQAETNLGQSHASKVDILGRLGREAIAKIDRSIERLKGEGSRGGENNPSVIKPVQWKVITP